MRLFIVKSFFILLIILLPVSLLITLCDKIYKDEIFNDNIEYKLPALIKDHQPFDLIIAGDSAAERGIIPEIIERETGLNTMNIAGPGCGIVATNNLFKKYPFLINRNTTLFITATIFQVNDGAIDTIGKSKATMVNLSLLEKIKIFKWKTLDIIPIYKEMLLKLFSGFLYQKLFDVQAPQSGRALLYSRDYKIDSKGFFPTEGKDDSGPAIALNPDGTTNHPWYKNINLTGVRWKIFKRTLAQLDKLGCKIIIIKPPASPSFKQNVQGSFIDQAEKEYSENMRKETLKYPNISFIDFYDEIDSGLEEIHFYDIQHTNKSGAKVFTKSLLKYLSYSN
ncbi:hypothetical protein ACFLZ3_03150 [Candidatus Omnitrophota bacterium]